jgi:hypothetical protein
MKQHAHVYSYFNQACPRCEQSGKVEYKRERLAGNRQKINEFLAIPSKLFALVFDFSALPWNNTGDAQLFQLR